MFTWVETIADRAASATRMFPGRAVAKLLRRAGIQAMRGLEWPICQECERLWRDYQRATAEYLHLLGKLRTTANANEEPEALLREVSQAEFKTKQTKDALDHHRKQAGHR